MMQKKRSLSAPYIPLFATAQDAVKDIKVEQATIKVQVQSEEQKDERED